MRVLITGGVGFLGSHVVHLLSQQAHEVMVVDDLSTGELQSLHPAARLARKDVRAPLDRLFRSFRPEVVLHLAAQVSVPKSVSDPLFDASVNIRGTINVVEAAARAGARKIVAVSSAAVYGAPVSVPLTEESPTGPLAPYGLSKLVAEHYVRMLTRTLGLDYTILRPSNLYGRRQKPERDGAVIAALLTGFLSGADPVIHGDGSQTRDFLHVTDMARATVQALDRAGGETLNVSSGTAVTILALWETLANLIGWSRQPQFGDPRPGDIAHSWMANDRARVLLDWEPTTPLLEGLADTVAWILAEQAAPTHQ